MTGEPRVQSVRPRRRLPLHECLMGVAVAVLLLVPTVVGNGVEPGDEDPDFLETVWSLEISQLEKPEFRLATGFTALHLSASGETLIAAVSSGSDAGILFLDAETGQVTATAQTKGHGPVMNITSDRTGQVAGFVYEDGYIAVADRDQNEPLVSRFNERGAPESVRDRIALELSPDGETLVMASDRLQVYRLRGEPPGATFEPPIADRYSTLGPHLFLHPVLPIVAAMDDTGTLGVFDLGLHPQIPAPVDLVDSVADVAVSSDGSVFAVLQKDGRVSKYQIIIGGPTPELEKLEERSLRCSQDTCGGPFGVALDADGSRMLAWTNQEVLWSPGHGNTSSSDPQENATGEPVRLDPDDERLFAHVVPDVGLDRALVTQFDPDGRTTIHHHAFPSGKRLQDELGQDPDPQGSALHPVEGLAFVTRSTTLQAFPVTPSPSADLTESGPGGDPGGNGLGGIFSGDLVTMMAGLGALGFTAFLAVLVVAARRGDDGRLISELELDKGSSSAPASARPSLPGGSPMSKVRLVTPSAPPEPDAPDGLLVLSQVKVPGSPGLEGLDLSLNRPGVVRVVGRRGLLVRFQAALAGKAPTTGTVSAGGAVRASTPMLFASHLHIGLPAPRLETMPVRDWYVESGVKRGVPKAVVSRRLQADLGWMGPRLDAPYAELSGFDRWRTRLAVAFSGRPKVLVVWSHELPDETDEQGREKVRKVLFAVARRYGAVVVVLDPGAPLAEDVVRGWAHEEFRLTPSGFRDRALLEQGRVVHAQPATRAGDGPRRPVRTSWFQRVVQDDRRRRRR